MNRIQKTPVLRKRIRLSKQYADSMELARLRGDDVYYPDAHCHKCGLWAVHRVSDGACCGCDGSGPYAGKLTAPKHKSQLLNGYYFGRNFRARDARSLIDQDVLTCAGCEKKLFAKYNIDHIHPFSMGGPSEYWNGQILCFYCNSEKGNMLPSEWFKLKRKPMPELFKEEFAKFYKAFTGLEWVQGGRVLIESLPLPKKTTRKSTYRRVDPTMIDEKGKLILTPAKHWHKDYI